MLDVNWRNRKLVLLVREQPNVGDTVMTDKKKKWTLAGYFICKTASMTDGQAK